MISSSALISFLQAKGGDANLTHFLYCASFRTVVTGTSANHSTCDILLSFAKPSRYPLDMELLQLV
jgi:hypothetical protein